IQILVDLHISYRLCAVIAGNIHEVDLDIQIDMLHDLSEERHASLQQSDDDRGLARIAVILRDDSAELLAALDDFLFCYENSLYYIIHSIILPAQNNIHCNINMVGLAEKCAISQPICGTKITALCTFSTTGQLLRCARGIWRSINQRWTFLCPMRSWMTSPSCALRTRIGKSSSCSVMPS